MQIGRILSRHLATMPRVGGIVVLQGGGGMDKGAGGVCV